MIAVKGNKAYTIEGREAKAWAARGYDVYGDDGIVEHGSGKTVSREEHERALARIAELEEALRDLSVDAAVRDGEVYVLDEMKRDDLVELAKRLGAEVPSKATKDQIVALIRAAEGGPEE